MVKTMNVPFTRNIQTYLAGNGYTHVYNKGIASDKLEVKDESDIDYILIPIKENDPLFQLPVFAKKIEKIKSNEVYDMADDDPFIDFFIQVPVTLYEKYLKS